MKRKAQIGAAEAAGAGRREFILACAGIAIGLAGCRTSTAQKGGFGGDAMDPLPRRVVCFDDITMTYGLAVDYAVPKSMLKRIADNAGSKVHFAF